MSDPTASKGDFATLCNVAKSRVSHWIKDGTLSGDALVGTGRSARIHIETGRAQIATRRDASQALGNGRKTKVGPRSTDVPTPAPAAAAEDDEAPDYELERALLTRQNRIAREMTNAVRKGDLIPSAAVEARYANLTTTIRSRMLTVPARVKEALPKLTASDVATVDAVVRAVLTEASRADLA